MPYSPLTPEEEKRALKTIGAQSVEDLFSSIPPKIRELAELSFGDADPALSEHELREYFSRLAEKNTLHKTHFLGGGVYDNVVPAIVNQLVLRGEFLTCYTPYQSEVSQGTLQAIFEFQTLISRITGMEVSNASMYDGASAAAEAVLMAQRIARRPDAPVVLAGAIHPEYAAVIRTYTQCAFPTPLSCGWNSKGGVDLDSLATLLKENEPAAVVVSSPNDLGIIEDLEAIKKILPANCLLIVSSPDPSALSIFETPAAAGADIVVGEAHQFGTPMLFAGPHVGFFATRKKYVRQMPGRLVGETVDSRGNRAYALTLATREQHIRREKATSNICTNQGLIALRTTIYLSFLGKQGFTELGTQNYSRMQYLITELERHGIPLKFKEAQHYREAVFEIPNLDSRFEKLLQIGIVPGIRLEKRHPDREELKDGLLVCVHPKHTKAELDALVEGLSHG